VTVGGAGLVAVGDEVATSTDGLTWTKETLPSNGSLAAVTWDGTEYLAVGRVGGTVGVWTKQAGSPWTSHAVSVPTKDVAWNGTTFVAVGGVSSASSIATSADGSTWTFRQSPSGYSPLSVTWASTMFVAVGQHGTIFTSPAGVTWTERTSGTTDSLHCVAWDGQTLVAVGEKGAILTSPDGVAWTQRRKSVFPNPGPLVLADVTWTGTRFVTVGRWGTILTSLDGVTWTQQTSSTTVDLWGVAGNHTRLVAVGSAGTILTSLDSVQWTQRTSSATLPLRDVTWAGTQFVAVGRKTILTSPDGVTWSVVADAEASTYWLTAVAWNGARLVAVGARAVLTSPDGSTWTQRDPGSWGSWPEWADVTWGGGRFVAVGPNSPGLATSSDGIIWTIDGQYSGWAVGWNGTEFLALGGPFTAPILTSPDGVTWTERATGLGGGLFDSVAWSGERLVIVGGRGTILYRTPLAAPADPTASPGDERVTVRWSEVAGATSYNLYWSATAGTNPATGNRVLGASSPYLHEGLANGTTYYYVVTAVGADGEGVTSPEVSATPEGAASPSLASPAIVGGGCALGARSQAPWRLALLALSIAFASLVLARRKGRISARRERERTR